MKRILKSVARATWKGIQPFRRPLSRKFHAVVANHRSAAIAEFEQRFTWHFQATLERLGALEGRAATIETIVQERLGVIEARSRGVESIAQELNLVLDGMVRELTRLQTQIEMLHHKIDEQSTEATLMQYAPDDGDDCVHYVTGTDERPRTAAPENHWTRKSG